MLMFKLESIKINQKSSKKEKMIHKSLKIGFKQMLFVLMLLTCLSCKKQRIGLLISGYFDKTKVKIEYNDKVFLDSILSTNYSIGVAHKMALERQDNKYLKITVNDTIQTSVITDPKTLVYTIRLRGDSIIVIKSGKLTEQRY
jgi:hypothetical protein